jgi:hypothetical protein
VIRSLESSEVRGPRDAAGPTEGLMRWLRGGVVGLVASTLALTGHSLAAGMSLQPTHLVWASACAVPVAVALSGRRWTLPSLLTVLLGAQLAFHLAFAGMSHAGHGGMATGSMAGPMTTETGHGAVSMVLSHVVAAMLTAMVLRRGEDWCWSLVRLLTRPWRLLLDVRLPLAQAPLRLGVPLVAKAGHLLLLSDSQPRRGPPALAL